VRRAGTHRARDHAATRYGERHADTLSQTHRSTYHVAAAQFWSSEGCLASGVDVYVDQTSYRASPSGPQRATHVGVWAFVADTCGASRRDTILSTAGWREITATDFRLTGSLGSARLSNSLELYDWMSDTSLPVDVDIVWTGVGYAWTTKDRHHDEWGDTKYRWRSRGTGRTAEATGSISLAALPMPQRLSGSGWLVAQTSSSTTIEIGGKRPRAARVEYFHASPHMIFPGGTAVLWWWGSGSEPVTLHIDGGVGDVSDASYPTVAPSETTTYTLTASNRWGSSSAEVTLHVIPPPDADAYEPMDTVGRATAVTLDFRADLTLLPGDVDRFTFTLDEATTVRIVVDPTYPMTYPLVALLDAAQQIIAGGLSWSEFDLDAGT
jgi:hypothetical protein